MTTGRDFVPPDIECLEAERAPRGPATEAAPGADVLATKVAAFETSDAGVLDEDQLEDLRGMFGEDALATLLTKFRKDLCRRLDAIKAGASRAEVAANAHAMISSAGSLGFTAFSDLCRTIEHVADGGGDVAPSIAAFAAASDHVQRTIESLAGPMQS